MFNDLANRKFRNAFLAENIRIGIAMAIRAIRESQSMTKKELAEKARKPPSVISRLEDPNYGRYTIRTLLDIAEAFDVALLVKFVPYSKLISELKDVSPQALAARPYGEEKALHEGFEARSKALQDSVASAAGANRTFSTTHHFQRIDLKRFASIEEDRANETSYGESSEGYLALRAFRPQSARQGYREERPS